MWHSHSLELTSFFPTGWWLTSKASDWWIQLPIHRCHYLSQRHQLMGSTMLLKTMIFSALLKEFPDILTPTFSNPTAKHGVVHYISTEGPPIHSRARRLPLEKLAIARDEFRTVEEMGIIRRSTSQWASPLHMVPKTVRQLEAMWWLQTSQQCYSSRQIPNTSYTGSLY